MMPTPRVSDADVLDAIDREWVVNWSSPTVRELAAELGFASCSSTQFRLDNLVRAGKLERKKLSARRVLYRRAHVTAS